MTSTPSAPLLSVAPGPTGPAASVDAPACLAEVEAWLLEVAPVVAALRVTPTLPSAGQQRWLLRLAHDALRALDLLADAQVEAEAHGEPADAVEWLQTRAAAALAGARQLLAEQPAAA